MPCILLQSSGKPPQSIKNFSSIHPEGNTQLKILKWWVPLISALYLSFFGQNFPNTSQWTAPYIQERKHQNRHFISSKQQCFIHQQQQYKTSNLKYSRKSIMWFATIALGKTLRTNDNVKKITIEMYARSYITLMWICIIK